MPFREWTPDAELRRITRLIVEHVQPLRVVLFGSRARGVATAESDIDLLIEIEAARREDAARRIQELKWEHALAAVPPVSDAAALHAHQTAEKYLKASIVSTLVAPPRSHDLLAVLARCPAPLRDDERVRAVCAALNGTFGRAHYPEEREPTELEAREAARSAAVVREAARTTLASSR